MVVFSSFQIGGTGIGDEEGVQCPTPAAHRGSASGQPSGLRAGINYCGCTFTTDLWSLLLMPSLFGRKLSTLVP